MTARKRNLGDVLAEVPPGSFVAVDLMTNKAKAFADTFDELCDELDRRGVRDVAVIRAPYEGELEVVGLG